MKSFIALSGLLLSTTLSLAQVGPGPTPPIPPGTQGGIPYYVTPYSFASTALLSQNNPVLGGGASAAPFSGSRTGNTTKFATANGAFVNGHCVAIDSNGNVVDAGGACTTGGGGGTVTSGTAKQLAWYSSTGAVVVGLNTSNSSMLVTDASGNPSWSTTGPSGMSFSNPVFIAPALGTPASGNGANLTNIPTTALTGFLQAAQFPALTGDVTSSAGGLGTVLANANGSPGPCGSSTAIPQITINAKGLSTSCSGQPITAPAGSLTGTALPAAVTSAPGLLSAASGSFGTLAFQNYTTPPAWGAVTPNAGNFTTLGANNVSSLTGSLIVGIRKVTTSPVTVSATTDYFICANANIPFTINLPASPATGLIYLVKDCYGNASTNNITIVPNAGTIDGASNYIISANRGSVAVSYDGTQWEVN